MAWASEPELRCLPGLPALPASARVRLGLRGSGTCPCAVLGLSHHFSKASGQGSNAVRHCWS